MAATIATVPWLSPQQKQVVDELRALGGRGEIPLTVSATIHLAVEDGKEELKK